MTACTNARVRVYIACSIDGFIAGEGDDLSWLPHPDPRDTGDDGALSYEAFMRDVGALLLGRRTYDVVRGFEGEWPYGDRPVLVASHRPLDPEPPVTVRGVEGPIGSLVAEARRAAGARDVYIDGGALIREACAANLVDELTLTIAPIALGAGHSLFGGLTQPYGMEVADVNRFAGGMVQLRLVPRDTPRSAVHD